MNIVKAAQTLGRLGGRVKSARKTKSCRRNGKLGGKLGGRPPKYPKCPKYHSHMFSPATGKCYGCGFMRPAGN